MENEKRTYSCSYENKRVLYVVGTKKTIEDEAKKYEKEFGKLLSINYIESIC